MVFKNPCILALWTKVWKANWKWTKRAFININKWFINIRKSFINIDKCSTFININESFVDINKSFISINKSFINISKSCHTKVAWEGLSCTHPKKGTITNPIKWVSVFQALIRNWSTLLLTKVGQHVCPLWPTFLGKSFHQNRVL